MARPRRGAQSGAGDAVPASFSEADAVMRTGLELNAAAKNYLGWIEELCRPYLGDRVLEVGSGQGALSEAFGRGRHLLATDLSEANLDTLRTRFAGNPAIEVASLDVAEFSASATFDSVIMINVLEHIEDDLAALKRLRSGLRPGGHVVLYVPAFSALYSEWDRKIGHFRRYTMASLAHVVSAAGLSVVDLRYVNSLGAVMWLLFCRLLRQEPAQSWVIQSWDKLVVPLLHGMERKIRPPFGISVFCAGRREPD